MAVCETVNGDSVQTTACFPASEKSKKRPVPAVNPTQRHGVLANSAQKGQNTKKKKEKNDCVRDMTERRELSAVRRIFGKQNNTLQVTAVLHSSLRSGLSQ